jgi:Flp pilus assembly protein TadD
MNCRVWQLVSAACVILTGTVCAETETIDLRALAKKARPAVMLLVVSDAAGKEIATGTGFLVSSDGKLITNHHVIENAASAVAKAENGGLFPVDGVLADDPKNDLVLLKLKGKDLPFLPLGNSDKIEVGTRIAVIGSPLGLEGTLSEGIVSAVRDIAGEMRILQISAAISPGSSGSPVLDSKGDVVAVATSLLHGGQSLNFAVPTEVARALIASAANAGKPEPINSFSKDDKDRLFADSDFKALIVANADKDYAELLKRARALVLRYPENPLAHLLMAAVYLNLKFTGDAISASQKAIKLKPDDPLAWHLLGRCYDEREQIRDAILAYQQAIKLNPGFAEAWFALGTCYAHTAQHDEEIAAYQQAVKVKPDYARAWDGLALAYAHVGEKSKARDALLALEKLDASLAQKLARLLDMPLR